MNDEQQRALRRTLDRVPNAFEKRRLAEVRNVVELDLLVLEPVRRVDHHAKTQSRLDADVKVAESEMRNPFRREPLVDRAVGRLTAAVRDEKMPILPFGAEPRDRCAAEQERLGMAHGRFSRNKIEIVNGGPNPGQDGQGNQESFAESTHTQ